LVLYLIPEVYHRTRDIIFCDKSVSTVKMSKVITGYLRYIDKLYQMVENNIDKIKVDKSRLEQIRNKYKKYKLQTGAEIKRIYYISRDELFHSIYENADFSPETILDLIKEGERKTNQVVNNLNVNPQKLVPTSSQTSTA
jgi:NTE family protein